ncbi:hypothetical protein GQ600_3051 [Phytophthora cactorum]|nr:hypothetical protein GQ600_3051 [Phytophthora cactorum]
MDLEEGAAENVKRVLTQISWSFAVFSNGRLKCLMILWFSRVTLYLRFDPKLKADHLLAKTKFGQLDGFVTKCLSRQNPLASLSNLITSGDARRCHGAALGFLSPWCNVLLYHIHYRALGDDNDGDVWSALQVILPTRTDIYGEYKDDETFQIEFQNTREALALLAAVARVDYHAYKYLLTNHCGVDVGKIENFEDKIQVHFVLLMEHHAETDLVQLCGVAQRRAISVSMRAEMDPQREERATLMPFRQTMAVVFDATRRSQELANTRYCSSFVAFHTTSPLQMGRVSMHRNFDNRSDRRDWWKWLAYGCFSERARTHSALESLVLTDIDSMDVADMKDFSAVLSSEHPEEFLFGSPHGAVIERDMALKKGALVQWLLTNKGQPQIGSYPVKFSAVVPYLRTFSDDGKTLAAERKRGLTRLLAAIGSSLMFLTIDGPGDELDVKVILKHCPNLLELSLRNGCNWVRYGPALNSYLDALLQMLAVNQTLEYLEVTVPPECHNYRDSFRIHHLRAVNRGRKLSMRTKAAFLSATCISSGVRSSSFKSGKAMKGEHSFSSRPTQCYLDRRVISNVFGFATSPVYRQVYFREKINNDQLRDYAE